MHTLKRIVLFGGSENDHLSTWKTDEAGTSNNDQITIPTEAGGTYNFIVYWGDGKSNIITTWNDAALTHTFPAAGTYQIKIVGVFEGFRFNNGGDCQKLLSIDNGGKQFRLGNNNGYFYGCTNLVSVSCLNIESMTNAYNFFRDCSSLEILDKIDTSTVVSMNSMFYGCSVFNQSIPFIDTVSCTNMYNMFRNCALFNQDVNHFVTNLVTTFYAMFRGCTNFNQDISNFNLEAATNVQDMLTVANAWSTENYDLFLIEMGTVQDMPDLLNFRCVPGYTTGGAAETGRNKLVAAPPGGDGWTITDGGPI